MPLLKQIIQAYLEDKHPTWWVQFDSDYDDLCSILSGLPFRRILPKAIRLCHENHNTINIYDNNYISYVEAVGRSTVYETYNAQNLLDKITEVIHKTEKVCFSSK